MRSISIKSELKAIITICDGSEVAKSILLGFLREDHFGHEDIRKVFRRIRNLLSKGKLIPKVSTLAEDAVLPESARVMLRTSKKKKYRITTEKDAKTLIDILENYRKFRTIKHSLIKSSDIVSKEAVDPDALIRLWEDTLMKAKSASSEDDILHIGNRDNADDVVKKIIEGEVVPCIPTGIKQFDSINGGFKRSSLVVIGANTSGGKSAMAIQLLINMYLSGFSVVLVSLEMDREQVLTRILSNISGVDSLNISLNKLTKADKQRIITSWNSFQKFGKRNDCKYTIYTPSEDLYIRDILFRLKPYNYDVFVIDYASLLKQERDEQWKSLAESTRYGKLFAKDTNSVVVILAQVNDEERIRYSRAIKENCDNMWSWNYNPMGENNIITVNQQKARNQKVFPFTLVADFDKMIIRDYTAKDGKRDVRAKAKSRRYRSTEELVAEREDYELIPIEPD